MKVGIIHPDSGWILTSIAKKIAACSELFSLHTNEIPTDLDACYYVDVQNCWNPLIRQRLYASTHIGMFTHLDGDDISSFRGGWDDLDGIVHMCNRYYQVFLREKWYNENQMIVCHPGDVRDFKLRPLILGVAQRGGFEGKGDGFLQKVWSDKMPSDLRDHFSLLFKGKGWDVSSFEGHNIFTDEDEDYDSYQSFYHKIDYLLIPSLWEGGPMALLEALASGVPVIAADVGFVPDFLSRSDDEDHHTFVSGDSDGLRDILLKISLRRLFNRRYLVDHMSWDNYAGQLLSFVDRIKRNKGKV
jgi:hypothetical protein